MKKITEEKIFDLIDGKLSDEERSEILRELHNHSVEEALYRSLLMTEGYIKANALEKTSSNFTDQVTGKVEQLINAKKRNGVLYRALSIVGFLTISSMVGVVFLAGSAGISGDGTNVEINRLITFMNEVNNSLSFLSGAALQNLFFLAVAFTFFVFIDRLLMNHFNWKH